MTDTLELKGISKFFPGIVANDKIDILLRKGEIHALLGENGAGKSTLMSILFGLYNADEGEIFFDGIPVKIHNPNDATKLHIGMVHQHFKLVGNFTVLENIVLGAEDTRRGLLTMTAARKRVMELSSVYHLNIESDALVDDITVGMQQRVEILKMLYRNNDVLIFDEPTAMLTPQECDDLMSVMKRLASGGKMLVFITHKLNEIMQTADKVTVLRKGRKVATVNIADVSVETLSEMMVGRKVSLEAVRHRIADDDAQTVFTVDNLSMRFPNQDKYRLKNISFEVRAGEIVCLAGIDGNGQSELIYALTGLMKFEKGRILLRGEDITTAPIRHRMKAGMAHIPEDRMKHGIVPAFTLQDNLILGSYYNPPFSKAGFLNKEAIRSHANDLIERYNIRSAMGADSLMADLSGGNQQKAIIAREMELSPDLLIAVQPSRGLDIGAIEYVHEKLLAHRDAGKAVLLMSLELDEVLSLPDRILVMYEGEITGRLQGGETDRMELGLYMSGAKRDGGGSHQ